MSVRFSETSVPDSILSNQKSNKVWKGNYCTTNKLSNFQSLKWEVTNKPISDTILENQIYADATQLGKYGVLMQGKLGPLWKSFGGAEFIRNDLGGI